MISDQAYILHKRPFKNSSEIIKLLTEKNGIVDVISKGSKRPQSKLKGQLQTFIPTQVVFSGRNSLKTLISAEQSSALTTSGYINHVSMLYCNELMVLLNLDVELASQLFIPYGETIDSIQGQSPVSLYLRQFEWRICKEVGYELTLPLKSESSSFLIFDPMQGLVVDDDSALCQRNVLTKFINNTTLTKPELIQINHLMKCVVDHIVNGKTIKSRSLLMN